MNTAILPTIFGICFASLALHAQQPPNAQTPKGPGFLLRQDLPAMDGSQLKLAVLELEYKPGGKTEAHYHNGPVFAMCWRAPSFASGRSIGSDLYSWTKFL
ncbi:MAG: hypothetical protein ACR2NN_04805 [Bryobacteraceae bacterium]